MTQHWVEALFPPTFKYNDLGELLTNDKQLQEIDGTNYGESSRTTEPIKNIYERVRKSYNNELEIRRQKCIQVGEPLRKQPTQQNTSVELTISKSSNSEDLCLWTNHEIKILREEYQLLKQEKMKVAEELKVMKKAFKQKDEKVKQYRLKLEKQCEITKGLYTENAQMQIACKNINKELKAAQSVEVYLREDIADLENQKHLQQKIIQRLQKDLAQEKRNHKKVSINLEDIQQKFKQESEIREESIRLEFEIKNNKLQKEIDGLVKKLDKEINDHIISKKGLDQLRMHFASSVRLGDKELHELTNMTFY